MWYVSSSLCFVVFHPTATPEIYTLSLHDALPILARALRRQEVVPHRGVELVAVAVVGRVVPFRGSNPVRKDRDFARSEEHTSELQSLTNLVCRLLLEKKKHN